MESRTFNVHLSFNHELQLITNLNEHQIMSLLAEWLDKSVAEDSFMCFSHEIIFDENGNPYEDENGEVFDDI